MAKKHFITIPKKVLADKSITKIHVNDLPKKKAVFNSYATPPPQSEHELQVLCHNFIRDKYPNINSYSIPNGAKTQVAITKEGKEIIFKGILLNNLILNNIGRGLVKSKTIDYNNQETKIILNYRFSDNWNTIALGDSVVVLAIPTVTTTDAVTVLSDTSVTCSGNVTSDGGAAVTERGICYGTNPSNITTAGDKVASGTGEGAFDAILTGLSVGTDYYFRAYAINSEGTAYGSRYVFSITLPAVETVGADVVGSTTATIDAEVLAEGVDSVTERGCCWTATGTPTITNNKTSDGTGLGVYSSDLTDLLPETYYNVRAYATSASGTAYGAVVRFKTLTP